MRTSINKKLADSNYSQSVLYSKINSSFIIASESILIADIFKNACYCQNGFKVQLVMDTPHYIYVKTLIRKLYWLPINF